jgi:hypothetical protein
MALAADTSATVEQFRTTIEQALAEDERFGEPLRRDRDDGSTLATRFRVAEKLWIECALRPNIPQIRAGIVTTDRWLSEELEETIEGSGDSMSEFIELGFDEAGLDWEEPIVEHYREHGTDFYFATSFDLADITELGQAEVVDKTVRMLRGYFEAFKPAIEATNAEQD